ncbi:MAG: hypothetical protein ACLPHP_12225 [Candidatus Sulfotelmatobacter sp.]
MAEGLERNQAVGVRDCDGGAGEGALGDGFAQDEECWGKKVSLRLEGLDERRRSLGGEVQGDDTLPESCFDCPVYSRVAGRGKGVV